MPNWVYGTVSVTGTKENILKFSERFVFPDEAGIRGKKKNRFFHRSFAQIERITLCDEISEQFADLPPGAEGTFCIIAEFAWSVYGCIVDITGRNAECISLSDACCEDGVRVSIEAEENDFEEYITCDANGRLEYSQVDMPQYECLHCGSVFALQTYVDAEDYPCIECGKPGLVPVPEENTENDTAA